MKSRRIQVAGGRRPPTAPITAVRPFRLMNRLVVGVAVVAILNPESHAAAWCYSWFNLIVAISAA